MRHYPWQLNPVLTVLSYAPHFLHKTLVSKSPKPPFPFPLNPKPLFLWSSTDTPGIRTKPSMKLQRLAVSAASDARTAEPSTANPISSEENEVQIDPTPYTFFWVHVLEVLYFNLCRKLR